MKLNTLRDLDLLLNENFKIEASQFKRAIDNNQRKLQSVSRFRFCDQSRSDRPFNEN